MKLYVTARFAYGENRAEIERLCDVVRQAGFDDFCFIRDVENYQKVFSDPQELWQRALAEIEQCDALIIDVSDNPTGGRVVEAGIAYALRQPIIVLVQNGVEHKQFFDGIATRVITYDTIEDIVPILKELIT
jgi:2'-deoxynucleoside 5'-phosphate N-hydrolase